MRELNGYDKKPQNFNGLCVCECTVVHRHGNVPHIVAINYEGLYWHIRLYVVVRCTVLLQNRKHCSVKSDIQSQSLIIRH